MPQHVRMDREGEFRELARARNYFLAVAGVIGPPRSVNE